MPLSPRSTSPVLAAMLGAMPIQRLLATLQALGVPLSYGQSRGRAGLVEKLLTDDLVSVAALTPIMSFSELRKACGVCELETKANRVQVLEQRLLGAEAALPRP
jgi:hypothetical protein